MKTNPTTPIVNNKEKHKSQRFRGAGCSWRVNDGIVSTSKPGNVAFCASANQ
jgi:hypothetical protein